MAGPLHYTVELTLKEGGYDAFKKVAREIVDLVEADEPGTLDYQWYSDGSRVMIYERFADSAAMLAHLTGGGAARLPELLEHSDLTRFEVYGDPDEAATEAAAGFGAQFLPSAIGFSR